MGSILGQPMVVNGDVQGSTRQVHSRYATKLEFLRFEGEGIEDWILRVK